MDLKQLEAFVYVVKLGSFSKAAQTLYLTQPTISAHVASLERELGLKLIIRTTKEVSPSEAGRVLYTYAQNMLKLRDESIEACINCGNAMSGIINIAASSIPSQYVMPQVMSLFRETYPEISFKTVRGDSGMVIKNILEYNVEIGMTGSIMEALKCVYVPFIDDKLVIVTPNTEEYRILREKGFKMEQLTSLPFIIREHGSGTRREVELFLKNMGTSLRSLNVVAQMDDPDAIKNAVKEGLGISIMSKMCVADYQRLGLIQAFDLDNSSELSRKLYLVRHKSRPLSQSAAAFWRFVQEYYKS